MTQRMRPTRERLDRVTELHALGLGNLVISQTMKMDKSQVTRDMKTLGLERNKVTLGAPRRLDRSELLQFHGEGLHNREIARRTGMHHASVARILRELGVESNRYEHPLKKGSA